MKPDYRSMCEELLKHLEWYIEEDDVNEGEENEYWLKGKRDAMEVVSKTKKFLREETSWEMTEENLKNKLIQIKTGDKVKLRNGKIVSIIVDENSDMPLKVFGEINWRLMDGRHRDVMGFPYMFKSPHDIVDIEL